jgi:hypothetical protein
VSDAEQLAAQVEAHLGDGVRTQWDDVLRRVRDEVQAKLVVAHPGYDAVADDGRDKES